MNLAKLAGAILVLVICAQAQAVGRIADVTVVDRSDDRRLPRYWHDGQAYVAGTPGHEYQVKVRNREDGEVLAVVSVDGVNVITGETADPGQSGYVLAPSGALEVKGWRKSLWRTAAFYFTDLGDSYAARTGRPGDVGVIGVALFRRKPEPPQPFSGVAPAPRAADSAKSEQSLGTGHGRLEASQARFVEFERATAQPAEIVTIQYDSYRNLLAMGVIHERLRAPRPPRPFPGFVPDA
jgi:hypothetical protein